MWFKKKKSNEAPMPPKPAFPMPEPVKLPEISGGDSSKSSQDGPLMSPPISQEINEPIKEVPVQASIQEKPKSDSNIGYGKLNSNIHFLKRKEVQGNEEFFFLEKSNYISIRELLSEIDLVSRNSIEYVDEMNLESGSEDAFCAEFGILMEDIQKKILFVDKTLFGE